jgi:5-formyltetrahydrofolate cyclo-ligase
MNKIELRRLYKERRSALTAVQVAEGSQAIARLFFSFFEVEKMKAVHCYLPIRRQNEIDTFPIIYTIQEKYLKTKVVIPRSIPQTGQLEHYQWQTDMTLEMNQWGILEPSPASAISYPLAEIDVVIVPLLAIDNQGHRVGYGKGFYDKFLAQCRSNVLKIGLSFFDPIATIADTNELDIRLDFCITPKRVIAISS